MDAAGELWEWGKAVILGLLGLLVWYFQRSQVRIEKRLDDHDEELDKRAMVDDMIRQRAEVDQRFRLIEGDVKNLGEKFAATMQQQLTELRRDVFSALGEQNKRLDQLLLAITKRNNSRD